MSNDSQQFRRALGQFVTGVTVVTTLGPQGRPVGFTANSFSSVSLDPPLILWSLDKSASLYPVFLEAEAYAVHILTAAQEHLSNHFATAAEQDRFGAMNYSAGLNGIPLLDGCAARFQCLPEHHYEGGDHTIFVGRVATFEADPAREVLAYHRSRYLHIKN